MLAHELRNPLAPVRTALEIIRAELDVSMALCGLRDVRQASRSILKMGSEQISSDGRRSSP